MGFTPGGMPAVHADLHAMQTVDHLLALEMGRDSDEIVDRTGLSQDSGVLGISVDRLGPAEVDRERKVDEIVG